MKRILSISLVAAFTLLAGIFYGTTNASAQTTTTTTTTTTSTTPSQTVRCTIAQVRLNTRIVQVDKVKIAQTKTYTDIQTTLDTYITTAEAASYNTKDLVAARDAMKTALEAYTTKATAYSTALMATKNLSCGESTPAFTASLVTTRAALTDARISSLAVRTVIKEKAIPALTAYATWLKTNAATAQETK